MGKKPIRTSCRVIVTILAEIPIWLIPTPSKHFCIDEHAPEHESEVS